MLTPGPKFTKRGHDLADTEIYHPAKFHGRTSTSAGDIRYKNPADKETNKQKTNKQTVNDISTTCLSACVDNKYASGPDWRISPHADRRHHSCRTLRSTILQNFIALRLPAPEISVTKNPADKQTNKQTNSKRHIHTCR